ncbi:hypothetical protein AAFF_G00253350 [Aldrovandia affinis]|uniref:Uncharacterized protein n=1 Tax=Aldrovandia affinis TaxID=143900 RepID=A0AAD7SU70_9TELE|nr:hypothetical protein AAFF_G00253350 [Aldrovandia affinis]
MEVALARERFGWRLEMGAERHQLEREREHVARVLENVEERRALEMKVWEKERESLEEEIQRGGERAESQWGRARDALQEKDRMVEDLCEELDVLATRAGPPGGGRPDVEPPLTEEDRLKLEIWGEVELVDAEREKMEKAMSWEMGRSKHEIRKLSKEREEARKLIASAVKQMDAAGRQMEAAETQIDAAKRRVEEAVQEREGMEEELVRGKELLERERDEKEEELARMQGLLEREIEEMEKAVRAMELLERDREEMEEEMASVKEQLVREMERASKDKRRRRRKRARFQPLGCCRKQED